MEGAAELKHLIDNSAHTVFFGGAGVSTESGLMDFRSEKGIFSALSRFGHKPETLLSYSYFLAHPDVFYDYYKSMLLSPDVLPNPAHTTLAQLERRGALDAVITQNIDGLHQRAGSRNVLELHGSVHRNYCMACKAPYSLEDILAAPGVPRCTCGGIIRPDIVFYGEHLDEAVMAAAIQYVERADLLIVGGTSLTVYPAAGIAARFYGRSLALINKSETGMDGRATLVIREPIGTVLPLCL